MYYQTETFWKNCYGQYDCLFFSKGRNAEDIFKNLQIHQEMNAQKYMTGILPIAKYSSGSELNMFAEFTMTNEQRFSEYFGFTEEEVDELFSRYRKNNRGIDKVTRDDWKIWYDGYYTKAEVRLYNPRSIVLSLSNNNTGNYWTSSGPYDEIFSVMVVYGFLTYKNGKIMIPNKELMDKFSDMLKKEPSLGYVYRLAKESEKMLKATLAGDTDTMTKILELAHDTEVPLLSYNNETELTAVVNLVYLAARDYYRVEREDKSGIGYVDFIFYPIYKDADCIILELKVDQSPDVAIQQIKDKKYDLRLRGKLGEKSEYTGRILAVGISYDKQRKTHSCKVEILD